MPFAQDRASLRRLWYGGLLAGLVCLAFAGCGFGSSANPRVSSMATATPRPTATPQSVALTWQPATVAATSNRVLFYVPAPSDGRVVYACGQVGSDPAAPVSVWSSHDAGATWSAGVTIPNSAGSRIGMICNMLVDANNPKVLDIELRPNNGSSPPSIPVYLSTDGGQTWTLLSSMRPSLGCLTSFQGTLYAAGNDVGTPGIWTSHDDGRTWTALNTGTFHPDTTLWVNPQSGDLLAGSGGLAGSGEETGLYHSTDGGATWARVPASPLASDPFPTSVVIAPQGSGWRICNASFVGATPQTAKNEFACTDDLGKTWTTLPALNPSQLSPKGFTFTAQITPFAITTTGVLFGSYVDISAGTVRVALAPGASAWRTLTAPKSALGSTNSPIYTRGPGDGMLWLASGQSSPPFVTAMYP